MNKKRNKENTLKMIIAYIASSFFLTLFLKLSTVFLDWPKYLSNLSMSNLLLHQLAFWSNCCEELIQKEVELLHRIKGACKGGLQNSSESIWLL